MRYAYLHGFASSPQAKKATALAVALEARGIELVRPDLNQPSFARLSLGAALAELDRIAAAEPGERWCLVGSSLGGLMAAAWASLHPERIDKLVLLCPAFDGAARWPNIVGQAAFARWRQEGAIPLPDASGALVPVHWAFYEEMTRTAAYPEVTCPTLIVHGTRDQTVPIAGSRRYAAAHVNVSLLELDDDHSLLASTPRIVEEVLAFFGLAPALA